MIAKELISDNIPPIKPDDSGLRALKWMEEFKVSHLPIVDGRTFLGIITDDDILDMEVPEQPVSTISDFFENIFINENKHYYDALKAIIDAKIEGREIIVREEEAPQVVDIMTALKASIDSAKKKPMEKAKGEKKKAKAEKPAKAAKRKAS